MRVLAYIAIALGLHCVVPPAHAHPLAPGLIELTEKSDGVFRVKWRQSIYKLPGTAEKRPVFPSHCQAVSVADVLEDNDSLTAYWDVDCGAVGIVNQPVGVDGLADSNTDALVRVLFADGRVVRGVVTPEDPLFIVPERESRWSLGLSYANLGFEHILSGLDHLLFVFGLLLLVGTTRSLLATITAFTVGHSVTLSLAMLQIAEVPSRPVEVLIAASVYVLAVELARAKPQGASLLGRRPWLMAAGFGLLHGLGFAGALREVGLPEHEIPLSLFSFNVGIEVGQIAFVVAMLIAERLFSRVIAVLPPWSKRVPLYVMGSLAAMWMIERSVAALG